MIPFVIFSLPRSRSAWLSAFLDCGHDIGVECATVDEFIERLRTGGGTCETGAGFAWRLIRRELPDATFVVVKRPVGEVCSSLEWHGITGQEVEMNRRAAELDEIAAQPGVLTVNFADLASPAVCGGLFAHCLGWPLDLAHWQRFDGLNIQVDLKRQAERLTANRAQIAGLKAEVARRLAKPGLAVAVEPWSDAFWSEAEPLATDHFEEVDGGVEPRRRFKLDTPFMQRLSDAGILKLFTARLDGRLVGYYTWNVTSDVESAGLLIAQQGAWYVEPNRPKVACCMFDFAVEELRKMGVQCIFPHHRVQGRGANIGRFFTKRGAKKIQDTYCLWIGGEG